MPENQKTSSNESTSTSPKKKKTNVGKWIAIGCLIFVLLGIVIAVFGGIWVFKKAREVASDVREDIEDGSLQNTIINTVQDKAENEVMGAVNNAIDSLKDNTIVSETGTGDETIDDVAVTTDKVFITATLIGEDKTDATLTITNSETGKVLSVVEFGTGDGETVSNVSKQLDIDPGMYTFEIATDVFAQWTVVVVQEE